MSGRQMAAKRQWLVDSGSSFYGTSPGSCFQLKALRPELSCRIVLLLAGEMTDQTKFSVLCSLFTWTQRSKSSAKKRSKFRKFLDSFCKDKNYFSAIRLILPNLDRERERREAPMASRNQYSLLVSSTLSACPESPRMLLASSIGAKEVLKPAPMWEVLLLLPPRCCSVGKGWHQVD